MNEYLAAVKEYYGEHYKHLEMDIQRFDDGREFMRYNYTGEPPLKGKVPIVIAEKGGECKVYSWLDISIPEERRREAFELINYANREYYPVKVYMGYTDKEIYFWSAVPERTPVSAAGPVCERLAQQIRDLFWKYDAQFRLLSAPPAPTETKKRSANDPDGRWSVDFG